MAHRVAAARLATLRRWGYKGRILPTSPDGTGMPQVLTDGKRKVLTAEDELLLAEMERKYMTMAMGTPAAPTPTPTP